jgi:hypothetical protein
MRLSIEEFHSGNLRAALVGTNLGDGRGTSNQRADWASQLPQLRTPRPLQMRQVQPPPGLRRLRRPQARAHRATDGRLQPNIAYVRSHLSPVPSSFYLAITIAGSCMAQLLSCSTYECERIAGGGDNIRPGTCQPALISELLLPMP